MYIEPLIVLSVVLLGSLSMNVGFAVYVITTKR